MFLRSVVLAALLPGCLSSPEDAVVESRLPDLDNAVLVALDPVGNLFDIGDGSRVPLIAAPQGGHILLVGARVRSGDIYQLTATAALRDVTSNRVLGLEQRPLLLEERSDGWGVPHPTLDALPNVAVCPSAAAVVPIYDHEYQLEMELATPSGDIVAALRAMITPSCADSQHCRQDCDASMR